MSEDPVGFVAVTVAVTDSSYCAPDVTIRKRTKIRWTIEAPPNWKVYFDAIDPFPEKSSQITDIERVSERVLEAVDLHTVYPKEIPYKLKIHVNGKELPPTDPIIKNEPPIYPAQPGL